MKEVISSTMIFDEQLRKRAPHGKILVVCKDACAVNED